MTLIGSTLDEAAVVALETVSCALKVPLDWYVCVGLAAVEVVPSPKTHLKVSVAPRGSEDPELEKLTVKGGAPLVGLAEATATGIQIVNVVSGLNPEKHRSVRPHNR